MNTVYRIHARNISNRAKISKTKYTEHDHGFLLHDLLD